MRKGAGLIAAFALSGLAVSAAAPRARAAAPPELRLFIQAASADEKQAKAALDRLALSWQDGYAPLLVDLARFMRGGGREGPSPEPAPRPDDGDAQGAGTGGSAVGQRDRDFPGPSVAPRSPAARTRRRLLAFLEKQTGQRFGDDLKRWRRWYWGRPYEPHPDYAAFKAGLYAHVDPRMAAFFPPGAQEMIRLDEVDWGGVGVNGIPPLDHPKQVPPGGAADLKDKNVVFGIFLNGEARAYPKRILAWHEMARDRVGGVELAIVYCTLCGTVIPYGAEVGGVTRTFGTSGLLYRSNKLMFDEESKSLWSTVEGRPVLGALAGEPLELRAYPVVTTTWKEWRGAHPGTTVLALDTGFERDYAEGAAYQQYFATDTLMFEVPRTDDRLDNKEEVLALLVEPASAKSPVATPPEPASPTATPRQPVAIAAAFLEKNRLHPFEVGGRSLVVLTSADGANRVYDVAPATARGWRRLPDGRVETEAGLRYGVTEDALVPEGAAGPALPRVPARRAFWFGWVAQYPQTLLVE